MVDAVWYAAGGCCTAAGASQVFFYTLGAWGRGKPSSEAVVKQRHGGGAEAANGILAVDRKRALASTGPWSCPYDPRLISHSLHFASRGEGRFVEELRHPLTKAPCALHDAAAPSAARSGVGTVGRRSRRRWRMIPEASRAPRAGCAARRQPAGARNAGA